MTGHKGRLNRQKMLLFEMMCAVYQIAKKGTAGSRATSGPIKAKDGTLLLSGEDKQTRWEEQFNEVLNRPAPTISVQVKDALDTLPISTERFTEVEVRKAMKVLKNNKSSGMD